MEAYVFNKRSFYPQKASGEPSNHRQQISCVADSVNIPELF